MLTSRAKTVRQEAIDLHLCALEEVTNLFEAFHGYKGTGNSATYCFGVFEDDRAVAAFLWQPPPVGAAKALSSAPGGAGVLSLSRMVAVPKSDRHLRHISKPLKRQMRLIDRGRWPVLVTYSDASLGHTGHVYLCSGWQKDGTSRRPVYETEGVRRSSYSNGKHTHAGKTRVGTTTLTRWVHRVTPHGSEAAWLASHGWERVPVPGRTWASGNPAYTWRKVP